MHRSKMRMALIVLLRVHHEPPFSSYPGCWHLKLQLSSSSWDAHGVWESCRWDQLPTSWPTSSPSSTACRASSSSWCIASSANRYYCLNPTQDFPQPHSFQWVDPACDFPLQVWEQYGKWFKGIDITKSKSEKYTLSSKTTSDACKYSAARSHIADTACH